MVIVEITICAFASVGAISLGRFVGKQLARLFRKEESWAEVQRRVPEASTEALEYEPLYPPAMDKD